MRPTTLIKLLPLLPLTATVLPACGGSDPVAQCEVGDVGCDGPDPCADLEVGSADGALLIVTDGRSDEVDALLEDDGEALFRSPDLGIDTDAGVVVVQPVTPAGLAPLQAFNLGGVGPGAHKAANATLQRSCLEAALDGLGEPQGGDLLAAVRSGAALAANRASDRVGVLVLGISRLAIRDFSMAGSDLSTPEARQFALDALSDFQLIPTLDEPVSGVFFAAPDRGIDPLQQGGVRAFVGEDLCGALGVPCTSGIEPKVAR